MTTMRRLPVGDSATQWSRSAGTYNFALVDDPVGSPDEDATYTYASTGYYKDYFNFLPFNVPANGTITSIVLRERFRTSTAGGTNHMRGILKVNGVTYYSSAEDAWYGAYTDEIWSWSTNPNTGLAWTVDDVNGVGSNPLQTFGYECLTLQTLLCTQAYIEVNGTWSPPPIARKQLMRDDATSELMRDDVTGKLMRAVEGHNCACFAAGQTPFDYTITFAGVLLCPTRSWPNSVNLNQTWHLTQVTPETDPCFYRYSGQGWLIYVQFNFGDYRTWIRAYQPPGNFYFSFYVDEACFIDGIVYNMYALGDCGLNVYGHHGAALIERGWE